MMESELGSSYPAKPGTEEIFHFLSRNQALIVHCSGTPKGVGPGTHFYPRDLRNVCEGAAQGGISCSLLQPGDRFHGVGRHSTGTVGLVIVPSSSESIVAVSAHDAGSRVVDGVRVVTHECDIKVDDLEQSLNRRGDRYNEWVVRDFEVVGIFVADPAATWQGVPMQMPGGVSPAIINQEVDITVSQVAADFDGLPIYTLSVAGVLQWKASQWHPAAHSEIYRSLHVSHEPEVGQ